MAVEEESKGPRPANDNGSRSGQSLDPRILRIAQAIGRVVHRGNHRFAFVSLHRKVCGLRDKQCCQ